MISPPCLFPRMFQHGLSTRVLLTTGLLLAAAAPAAAQTECANPNALGVSRVVEIDTTGGPGFGFENYKSYDFLQPREVVLTFDDGPHKFNTDVVLAALAEQCTKAIFFIIGKNALDFPEVLRHVADAGQTIGTHTWSHANLRKAKSEADAIAEIERGMSATHRALGPGVQTAPFFRFPALADSPQTLAHLQSRNIAVWSTDIDSFDFKFRNAEHTVKAVIDKLEKKGKGIVLLHDFQKTTAQGTSALLAALKQHGFKIVQVKAKAPMQTLPEFDTAIEADVKGLAPANAAPISSVVRTVGGSDGKSNLGGASPAPVAAEQMPPPPAAGTPAVPRSGVAAPNVTGNTTGADGDATKGDRRWFWQQK